MPGVGKTMLAKEVKRKAEQDKLFDVVVMALVSKNADSEKIQVEIARGLGLDQLPNGIKTQDAAELIKNRLKNMKKVLIILDDIWESEIDLKGLGIPLRNEPKKTEGSSSREEHVQGSSSREEHGQGSSSREEHVQGSSSREEHAEGSSSREGHAEGSSSREGHAEGSSSREGHAEGSSSREEHVECKILLTSRDSNVLSDLTGSSQNFSLDNLEVGEAWNLLKKIVGDRAEGDDIHRTAFDIVQECGGLPLAITTMAKALKNKKPYEWRDALRKLRKPSSENFHGISAKVYSAIELSYSHLESEKLQELFLLCCVMGHKASIQDLLKFGVGLGLFANTIEEARDEVFTLISKLRASSFLIDDSDNNCFDMHDLIHDVAVSITSRDRHGLLLTGDHEPKEWSDRKAMKDFKWIKLLNANINGLPDEFESRQLSFFCLENNDPSLKIPADFFKGMQELKVLDLTEMQFTSLPSSICLLKDLHTLCFHSCFLGDISIIGKLKNLKVLTISSSDIKELPREIRELTLLKLLDLSNCSQLKIIPPCVLANMSGLEELYLGNSFDGWEVEENENQRNASIAELKDLKDLTTLEMTEELHLSELAGVKNVVDELNTEGFPDLKYLYVRNAPEVQHIAEGVPFNAFPRLEVLFLWNLNNLEKIFQGRFKDTAFNNLRTITIECCDKVALPNLEELQVSWINVNIIWHASMASSYIKKLTKLIIENCDNLEYLFTSAMARDLVMLEHLEIRECEKMGKVLFTENVEEDGNLIFPQLRILEIRSLPKLGRFCHGNCIKFPCLSRLLITSCPVLKTFISSSSSFDTGTPPLFDAKVIFPRLEQLIIGVMESMDKIWDNQLDASSFCQLNYLGVNSCNELLNIFPFSMLERLQRLDKLEIWSCASLEEIFESQGLVAGQSQTQKFTPPTLMESVVKFVFPKLTQLDLYFLPKLKALCHQMHNIEWPSLKTLTVYRCEQVQIFASELSSFPRTNGDDQLEVSLFWTSKATFPSLEEMRLHWNGNMKEIWHGQHIPGDYFPKLKVLGLSNFHKQLVVQPFLFQAPNLEKLVVSQASFHDIFKCQGLGCVEKPALAFTQLSGLRLSDLHELTCLWKEESNLELVFSNLKILEVLQCSKLKNLVPSLISFRNLTTLEVCACNELMNLIEYSTAKGMVQLTRMSISECRMLKEIMACVDDEVKDGIVFSQLKYLQLCDLPKLASFCLGSCNFEFVSLEEVIVTCPNMQIFSHGECSTPKNLQKVKLTKDGDEEFWEGNLNSTIQKMFIEKVGYRGLENLKLSQFPKLIEIWNKKPQEILPFKRLRSLEVCNCNSFRYLLTTSMALGLTQLWDLKVANCAAMEQVIIGEGAKELFPNLYSIILESCPNLKCFYEGNSGLVFPWLNKITVVNCPVLAAFAASFSSDQKTEITTNDAESEESPVIPTQPFFSDKVVLPNLEELQVRWMNVNIEWHTSITYLCVGKLKKLIIQGYDNLEYLFSSSIARGLVMLSQVEIRECKRMREIIVTGNAEEKDNLIFPQLNLLLLEDLQNIVGFYSGNCIVEFPSLKQLQVLNCPELEGFIVNHFASTNVIADKQPFFNEQVAFPNLESLTLTHLKNLDIIWQNQFHADSFGKLKSLMVRNCEKLSTIFPSAEMLGRIWKSLEKLILSDCGSLEVVFGIAEFNVKQTHAIIDTKLRELNIAGLPRLKYVWNKDPQGILTFHSLELVVIQCCDRLKFLFPASIGKSLSQLQELHLWRCGVEEIVTMGEQGIEAIVNFEFPRVSSLRLVRLPRLQWFYPGQHTTAWPILKRFYFSHFNHVKRTDDSWQLDFPVQLPLFSIEKVIPQLEELSLTRHDIAVICEHQFKEDLSFNIKVLQIDGYVDNESDVLPIRFLQRFCHLEELVVVFCNFKELFPSKGEAEEQEKHIEIETFSRIKTLNLRILPYLRHIWSHDSSIVLQNLRTLKVFRCESLISLSTSPASFQNLVTLNIHRCKAMVNLVSISIAQSLMQLTRMTVSWCYMLTEIVGNEGNGTQDLIMITFTKLRYLKLEGLPRLESFCLGNFTFKFPSLKKLIVIQCPKLMIFNEGDLSTPLLPRVELIEGEDKWCWEGDLNTTIQRMYMEQVGFAGLQLLMLSSLPKLLETWHIKNPQELLDFRQLRVLEICNCSKFRYLLTHSMALGLVQLWHLMVKNCGTMEQVIMGEGAKNKMEFPHLWLINLESCSDLRSFYVGSHSLELPDLNDFIVKDCPKLVTFVASASSKEHNKEESQYLFSSKISKCPVLKTFISSFFFGDMIASSENVKNAYTLSLFDAKVAFPKLERLVIEHVKSLNKIWNNQLEVDSFCQLTLVSVVSCENLLNIFQFSMLERLQRLDKLQIWNCDSLEEILESYEPGVSQSQAQKATLLPLLETVTCLEDDVKDEIVFSKLKYLQLCGLPRLSSFCSLECKFEFPLLEEVILMDCPSMQIFSMDEIRMPKLQKVKLTGDEDEDFRDGNLNSTIQLQFMQKSQGDFEN
ncbi:hypothetical protein SLEP1_g54633 [Rubroshorea leprosula]|uniref:Uncharacterized protein n=1 Tax=Rubroshorea leprosula TaxID=152421 RepID=A0AAV5MGR5_9ROSI|nr:hypothetical protein SLEP1_g54633 [Rubroshorea leprosula]